MTLSSIAALFGTMIVLAMIPSPSVFAVVARSMASGFIHGLVTAMGIVVGDFIFIILALYGLSAIAETMGSLFVLVKYLASAYLIWLGINLWRSKSKTFEVKGIRESSWLSNFLTGLFITLSDPKAILFYVSFFPVFLDLSKVSVWDIGMILMITIIAVGGSKLGYAYMADRARFLFKSSKAKKGMNIAAGTIMIATGISLLAKS